MVDNKGNTNGFKMALSGNKEFLYMVGIFNEKRELIKGKVVEYSGQAVEVDLMVRQEKSRLSGASINLGKLECER